MSDPDESVGPVAAEAAKLLHALQDWAKESGSEYAEAAETAAESVAAAVQRVDEHIATGAAECSYCPVCRVISAVRDTSPEVRQHLTSAATSLMHAAAGLLTTHVPEPPKGRTDGGVEKIDVSDDEWEDD